MPSATIKLFLVHGDAKRLRTAELSNWTGKAVAGPRSELESVVGREEAEKSGVYFLLGTDPDSGKAAVYVGEAESIRVRLRGHLDKDWWNHIVFFVSKDENLTKAHVRYLEGRLIEQAKTAGRAVVMNGQASGANPYTLVTRNRLIKDGALVQRADHFVFTVDVEFTSPSAAATVVHGGSTNGLLVWKTRDGKTLKELEAARP